MVDKIIEINNKTDFAHIMNYVNCETKLYRVGSKLVYFKFKNGEIWEQLVSGDNIIIDQKYNIHIIK